ncbi:MAG: DNA polymerase IV [Actinomycetes bacterium]|jgi:DNA polymerase-4
MTHRQVLKLPHIELSGDDSESNILHVDMDAFFASVELRDRPELKGLPVVVGHSGGRGVVTSATYEARKFGIHAAMSMTEATRRCPKAIFIEPNHEKYSEVSEKLQEIYLSFTPLVEPLSVDEAFLDVSGSRKLLGTPIEIGKKLREKVFQEENITCSVGIAPTKFIAKLASTRAKPDGLIVVSPKEVIDFLHPLPVGALWGVGGKTEEVLKRLGLFKVSDIANLSLKTLKRALGDGIAEHLYELSWGKDERSVETNEPEKSVGNEETFSKDLDQAEDILREVLRLSEKVAARLRQAGLMGRTITLKVRFSNFSTITRSKTLLDPTDVAKEIYEVAKSLFEGLKLDQVRVRLVGVRVEKLVEEDQANRQLLLGENEKGWREIDKASDKANARFGDEAIKPARLLE